MHDTSFYYGQYGADMQADSNAKIASELVLKKGQIKSMEYMKKEGDQPVEGELPVNFANTSFHIIYMYPTNITVVSKVSLEIVYSQNFKDDKLLRGLHLDIAKNQLIAYCPQKLIAIANLVGEDKDAWKFYLKKGKNKLALKSCRSAKQRALVNGTIADTQLKSGKYGKAAEFYARSNYSFEQVSMKFLKYKQM